MNPTVLSGSELNLNALSYLIMFALWHNSFGMVYDIVDPLARGSGSGLCVDCIKSLPQQIHDDALLYISGDGLLPGATQVTLGQRFVYHHRSPVHSRAVSQ